MTGAQTLKMELDKVSKELTEKYDQLGMRASGRWESEKEVTVKESGTRLTGIILGSDYTRYLQFGRKPGRFPPIDSIEQWIKDKRITSDIPIRSLAFLIARKIAREGTRYFQQGGTNMIDSIITPERIDEIISKVGLIDVEGIVKGLVKEIEKYAKVTA